MSVPACPVFMRENLVFFPCGAGRPGRWFAMMWQKTCPCGAGTGLFLFAGVCGGIGWFRGRDDREAGFQNVPDIFGLISKRIRDFYVAPAAGDSLSDLHPRNQAAI